MCSSAGAFYGRRGRINACELWEQMNTCSCLNLILACIIYWQACEISRVLSECAPVAISPSGTLQPHRVG
jgi:TnpA family transposase